MTRLWGIRVKDGVATLGGAVIVHESREEIEFLFPGREAVDVTGTELPTTPLKTNPAMAGVQFPIRREDFR